MLPGRPQESVVAARSAVIQANPRGREVMVGSEVTDAQGEGGGPEALGRRVRHLGAEDPAQRIEPALERRAYVIEEVERGSAEGAGEQLALVQEREIRADAAAEEPVLHER